MKKYLLAIAISGASSLAYSGTWEAVDTINKVWVNSGTVYGALVNNQLLCGSKTFQLIAGSTDSEKGLVMSILLSANVSGKNIQLHTTGNCNNKNTYINGVRIL